MFSTSDMALGVALLLLGSKRKKGSGDKTSSTAHAPKHPTGQVASPVEDAAHLLARANQTHGASWATLFSDVPVSPLVAQALARWAMLESSGNPVAVSKLGERGLMQAGPQTVSEGGMSKATWDKLTSRSTSLAEQAQIAVSYVDWLWQRAARYIEAPPVDPVDQVWYAYLYHQRPVDVRDGHMHGPAAEMSIELASTWHADPHKLHRLMAANVVAWGDPRGAPSA